MGDVHFPAVLYKKLLLGQTIVLQDVASLDPSLTSGLRQLLDYEPPEEVEDVFCRSFEVTWEEFGLTHTEELMPGGADIPVTGTNREEYVRLYIHWLLNDSVQQQFDAFERGFRRVFASDATLSILSPRDLELLVAGTPDLDFRDLEEVAVYEAGFTKDHPTIRAFWEVVHGFEPEAQRQLLMFTTGSIKAPIGGLSKLPFKIQRAGPDSDNLPTSHTCFNTI